MNYIVIQGSQTYGPPAVCSPPDAYVRPANILKIDKCENFDQIFASLFWGLFLWIAACKSFFYINCDPRIIFYLGMWLSDTFEFEIPAVIHDFKYLLKYLQTFFFSWSSQNSYGRRVHKRFIYLALDNASKSEQCQFHQHFKLDFLYERLERSFFVLTF